MIFWDTSALVRAYDARETHHARALNLLTREGSHVGSLLLHAEAAGAVARRLGRNPATRDALLGRIAQDLAHFHLVVIDGQQVAAALRLIRRHALRGADALHLAAALEVRSRVPRGLRFCSSDREQLRAAHAEGLRTIGLGA